MYRMLWTFWSWVNILISRFAYIYRLITEGKLMPWQANECHVIVTVFLFLVSTSIVVHEFSHLILCGWAWMNAKNSLSQLKALKFSQIRNLFSVLFCFLTPTSLYIYSWGSLHSFKIFIFSGQAFGNYFTYMLAKHLPHVHLWPVTLVVWAGSHLCIWVTESIYVLNPFEHQ